MNVPKISIENQLRELNYNKTYAVIMGNFKEYTAASKEYAKLAVRNYDIAKNTNSPSVTAPIFTKMGLRMFKIWFLNLFRIKSPEERLLRQMGNAERAKNMLNNLDKNA
ncbi:MAG: hypothetical protein MJ237_00145 [bacterium]|nr:hypothetical protein [bacterium]